jgi:hypothetical protein
MCNSADINAYFALHQLFVKSASKPVRKLSYILDKSIYVLVASLWEAYCEDVVTEALNHLVARAPAYGSLPPGLISDVEKSIRSGKDSPWVLAGDGWRQYIRDRREGLERRRNKDFASPKSEPVEQFLRQVLGIESLCEEWRSAGWPGICDELDAHLDRRNTLVHRITPGRVIDKGDVRSFYKTVRLLVRYTDKAVDVMLTSATGESRWASAVPLPPYEASA